ncbi:prepilin-type N-terminal cleavage/methylation domain-containing protein [Parasedimentitalea marina]|nr:prepilin-type N-terminal cleavage/methylation domain-containing protein [Parasedimentitalea marina]
MPEQLTPQARTSGLTLVELAVAILVLAIGSMAALRATDQSRLSIGSEMPRILARLAARNRAEELQLYGPGHALPGQVTLAGQPISIETHSETTAGGLLLSRITARAVSGEAAMLVVYLPPGCDGETIAAGSWPQPP